MTAKKLWETLAQANKGVLLALLLLGIALMVLPTLWRTPTQQKAGLSMNSYDQGVKSGGMTSDIQAQELILNENAETILSKIKGVGQVQVWVSLEQGAGYERSQMFNEPTRPQATGPKVRGVVVAAQGAGNSEIRWRLYQAVKALYDIPLNAIFIAEGMEESK